MSRSRLVVKANDVAQVFRQRDFLAGLLFLVIGAAAALQGLALRQGTADRMGPGYLPLRLGLALALLGAVIALSGLRRSGAKVESAPVAPLIAATAALVIFSLVIEHGGLVLASVLLIGVARALDWRGKQVELVLLILCLVAFVVVVFRYGLGVPVELWPSWGA